MKKNLFKKIFGLCVMMIAVLALVACGGGKEKIEFSFETNTLTVEVGQEFTLKTVLSGATSEVEFSFDKEGFVEYKDGKFVALKDGTVTVTGTLKDF